MTTSRLLAAIAIVLLAGGAVAAQPTVAPPPHLALDELVKEYQRYGLPLPPPGAQLVAIGTPPPANDAWYYLAFRRSAPKLGADPSYFVGDGLWPDWWFAFSPAVPIRPDQVDPQRVVYQLEYDLLCLAVHCRLRGWDDLARALHDRAVREVADVAYLDLRNIAWGYWKSGLTRRGTDRQEILGRLRGLAAEDPTDKRTDREGAKLFRRLELTLAPRTSKPGTVEALIDDLTDYWLDPQDEANPAGQEAYWRLAEMGFDAMPAIIAHLRDERLTRAYPPDMHPLTPDIMSVGHLLCGLVRDLSGRTVQGWELLQEGKDLDPAKVREWFEAARKVGEERWLLDHAVPAEGPPVPLIVRVIGAKYPSRLPAVYRDILRGRRGSDVRDCVPEVVASRLPQEQKIALLEEGVATDGLRHRLPALEGLAGLDRVRCRKHLLATLREMEDWLASGREWAFEPADLVPVVEASADPACWDAMAAVARVVPVKLRTDFVAVVGPQTRQGRPDPARRERLRWLVGLLGDRTVVPRGEAGRDGFEVRDLAAQQLAGMLRLPVHFDDVGTLTPDPSSGALSRLILREAARQAAARELAAIN